MKIKIFTEQIIEKIIPLNIEFDFDIEDFEGLYEINSLDDLEDSLYDYLISSEELGDIIYNAADGDHCLDVYPSDFSNPIEIKNYEELLEYCKPLIVE